jgi:hypothetical protein
VFGGVTYLAAGAVVVIHGALAVGPEGVEETVVGACSSGSGAGDQGTRLIALLSVSDEAQRRGKRRGGAAESEQDGRESDHVD